MKPKLLLCLLLLLILKLVTSEEEKPGTPVARSNPRQPCTSSVARPREKRQLFDGARPADFFQLFNSGALEGVDSVLRSTRNFDVFQCLERFSCEMTAPLSDAQQSVGHDEAAGHHGAAEAHGAVQHAAAGHGQQLQLAQHGGAQHAGQVVAHDPQLAAQAGGLQFAQPGVHYIPQPAVQQFIQPFAYPSPYYHPGLYNPYAAPQLSPFAQPVAQQQQLQHAPQPTQAAGFHGQVQHAAQGHQVPQHQQIPQHQPTFHHQGFRHRPGQPHAPPPVKRSGTHHGREEPDSWFAGYRDRVQNRQEKRNWFRRMIGYRKKRSAPNQQSFLEAKSRVRRGIFDAITKSISGKEVVGVLDRMMHGTDDSLYPYTRAALMGYMGSPKTCAELYRNCPTTTDELIHTFNNLRSYFPNGIPFKDKLPAPLRFLLP